MSRKPVILATLLLASLGATSALAWPGLRGRDWESSAIRIQNDASATVTATNITKDANPGNKSRVVLLFDGVTLADDTADADRVSATRTVTGNGRHVLEAVCYNERATADRCSLSVVIEPERPIG